MTGPIGMVTGRLRRVQDSVRQTRAAVTRPKPPVEVDLGRSVPAWLLRLLILVVSAGAIVILKPPVVSIVIIGLLAVLAAVRPLAATGAVLCAAYGFFWMIDPTPEFGAQQFALMALAPALWMLAGTIADIPLRTRVELAVFRHPLLRFVIIDLVSQLMLVGAQLLHRAAPGTGGPAIAAIVLACAVLLAVAAWLILPRLNHPE
jgi:hypothetical protein